MIDVCMVNNNNNIDMHDMVLDTTIIIKIHYLHKYHMFAMISL